VSPSSREIDGSHGWEAVAETFIRGRAHSPVGRATVQAWARSLPEGGSILDLGCGSGVPISEAMMGLGFSVYGVDASPSMVAAFRTRFPDARVVCETAETSLLFSRAFDGAVAWGLIFLLPPDSQRELIRRVAGALHVGGRFLFTAPARACTWSDLSTDRASVSLGARVYKTILETAGLTLVDEYEDEGQNHYFDAVKGGSPTPG
jgi:SAM-dependent methyltransferase